MAEVLVLIDGPGKGAQVLLTVARRLGEPSAVVFGADVPAELAEFGAAKVYQFNDSVYTDHLVAPKAEAIASLVASKSPAAVIVPATSEGKEIGARVALKSGSGLITDAVDVQADGTTTQSVFAGNFTVDAKVTKGAAVLAVKSNATAPEAAPAAGAVEAVTADISDSAKGAKIVSSAVKEATSGPELTEADIVVSGGRGTGGDFSEVEALAAVLGAAVGASRAAVDSGWKPHSYQVGQTGKTVSPQLYIANGISGAIQHRAGMQTSKTIVAVNKDEEAPIFELVDFGVVGDLKAVLPQATEEIKKLKG